MRIIYLNEICKLLLENNIYSWSCRLDEIEKIEEFAKFPLPIAYKEFLYVMGKRASRFLEGSSCFYDEIFELKEWAEELLLENKSILTISENDFVFFMHQGYQFAFFRLNKGDNPTVYYYHEGENSIFKEKGKFTDFLTFELKSLIV